MSGRASVVRVWARACVRDRKEYKSVCGVWAVCMCVGGWVWVDG